MAWSKSVPSVASFGCRLDLMHTMPDPKNGFYLRFGKPLFDVFIAVIGVVVLLVPMGFITLGILLCDGPPVLFRQARVGRRGRLFAVLKFRTMRVSSERRTTITVAGDSRVTRVGRFLRRFKLDELPQMFNVLKGDMSFVGPRPDVPGYMDKLQGEAAALLELRPGITGPATLAFRHEEKILGGVSDPTVYNDEVIFPEKVRLNLVYLREASLRCDLRYIYATVANRKHKGLC